MAKQLLKLVPMSEYALEINPIIPARSAIPEWYKSSPQRIEGTSTHLLVGKPIATTSTYKGCSPFLDGLTAGYMAVLTADIEVTRNDVGMPYFMWRTPFRTLVSDHTPDQWQGMQPPKGYAPLVMKWVPDVALQPPAGYSILFTHPMNRYDLPFLTLSGIVDTDTYHEQVLFPFWIREDFQGVLEKGTPICQFFPFKREDWKTEQQLFDARTVFLEREALFSRVVRSYKSQFWVKKRYE